MNALPVCILYTSDADLQRRITVYGRELVDLQIMESTEDVHALLSGYGAAVLLLDLTESGAMEMARSSRQEFPRAITIALGVPRSDPMLEAEHIDLFAVEDLQVDHHHLQAILRRAIDFLRVTEENVLLRENSFPTAAAPEFPVAVPSVPPPAMPFSEAMRHFDDPKVMFQNVVDGVACFAHVSRVGLFSLANRDTHYRFRAGTKCLPGTRDMAVSRGDPLVRWLARQAYAVSRRKLPHVTDPQERVMLSRALDVLGSELIIPLHGRERVIGWLFVGHHVTGIPFEQADIENLVSLAEYVSLLLDNALLYDEVTMQKTLAETVLHSIPVGIVASDAEGVIRWFNGAASAMLLIKVDDVMDSPAVKVGTQLADLLSRTVKGDVLEAPRTWEEPHTGRTLSAAARPLRSGDQCLGAVVLVQDLTHETALRKKQEQVERTSFWAELAAAMSHEVRNPLVAISTFAQLLPERYEDAEFREQFSVLVAQEIGRLNGMIEQINTFANPPDLMFGPVRIDVVLSKATAAAVRQATEPPVRVERTIEPGLPELWGDEHALVECFTHLILNAMEAVSETTDPVISVRVSGKGADTPPETLSISVRDNGRGTPPGLGERAFSPFYTTKARGIGLGLPIARRTVTDHGGDIQMEGDASGTALTVSLPVCVGQKERNEAHLGSG